MIILKNYLHACMHAHVNGKVCNLRMACAHVCRCVCACVCLYTCSCYIYNIFLQTQTYSLFHSISFKKNKISVSNRIIKMSNITNEKKELEQLTDIDHTFTFNNKVSNIVDDYLIDKEMTKSGLKRKREPTNHFKFKLVHV